MDTQARTAERVTISEVARLTGIPVPTIRSWERRYSFPSPPRTSGGHRRYTQAEVELLRDLRREVGNGRNAKAAAEVVQARASAGEGDLDRVVTAAREMDPEGVRAALSDAQSRLGTEGALQHVAFPSVHRLKSTWEKEGDAGVVQRNLLMEEIRKWLGCLQTNDSKSTQPVPVLLAAATGEEQTLKLDGLEAVLKQQGWSCVSLGSTPPGAVAEAARRLGRCAVVITADKTTSRREAMRTIELLEHNANVDVFYGGDAFAAPSRRRNVAGTHLDEDLTKATLTIEESVKATR